MAGVLRSVFGAGATEAGAVVKSEAPAISAGVTGAEEAALKTAASEVPVALKADTQATSAVLKSNERIAATQLAGKRYDTAMTALKVGGVAYGGTTLLKQLNKDVLQPFGNGFDNFGKGLENMFKGTEHGLEALLKGLGNVPHEIGSHLPSVNEVALGFSGIMALAVAGFVTYEVYRRSA